MWIESHFKSFFFFMRHKCYLFTLKITPRWHQCWDHLSIQVRPSILTFPVCQSYDIRAATGIQTQQLGLNVDSLETTESSWGQTSVCQSLCVQGNRINTAANCQVKLKPRTGWCFSVTRKLTSQAGTCQMCTSAGVNLFDCLWPASLLCFQWQKMNWPWCESHT